MQLGFGPLLIWTNPNITGHNGVMWKLCFKGKSGLWSSAIYFNDWLLNVFLIVVNVLGVNQQFVPAAETVQTISGNNHMNFYQT